MDLLDHARFNPKSLRSVRKRRTAPIQFLNDDATSFPMDSKRTSENGSCKVDIQRKELKGSALNISSINKNGPSDSSSCLIKDDAPSGEYGSRAFGNGSRKNGLSGNRKHKYIPDLKRCNEGKVKEIFEIIPSTSNGIDNVGTSNCLNHTNQDCVPNGSSEKKPRKVKIKLSGVTHTINAKSNLASAIDGGASNPPHTSDTPQHLQKLNQDNSGDAHPPSERGTNLQGDQRKKGNSVMRLPVKQNLKITSKYSSEPVRKSTRVLKKRVLDEQSDEEEDDEIQYLEKLKRSKASVSHSVDSEFGHKEATTNRKNSKTNNRKRKSGCDVDDDFDLSHRSKDTKKKPRSGRKSKDANYTEEEQEPDFEADPETKRRNEEFSVSTDDRKEMSLTTRQRALQFSKDGTSGNQICLIEFPDGLPPAPSRRKKGKLSEVEQQLKKAEAAKKRRLQVEKAAKELEAGVIKKILGQGQESGRKKREGKLQEMRDKIAQEKIERYKTLPSNMVRCVSGPTGRTVTFPNDVDLPSIFNSKPCSYPPPREKCAGPACTNPYKYRDSKLNLPLCSLHCYKAVQQNTQQVTT